jgi:hypothetical protein
MQFEVEMQQQFKVKLLNVCKYILGIKVKQTKKSITIYQEGYLTKIIEEFKMLNCNLSKTPIFEKVFFALIAKPEEQSTESLSTTSSLRKQCMLWSLFTQTLLLLLHY